MFAYVNGSVVDEADAAIDIFDHGFTVGDGVFETIALRQGTAFAVTRHLTRMVRSAIRLGLPRPELQELLQAVDLIVSANPELAWGAIRVTYTSGPGTVGSGRTGLAATTVVAAREMAPHDSLAEVITVPWPRNERGALVGVKTTSYAENALALADAHRQGATEAIFANTKGNLCEGSGTNVFVVINGQLVTPPLSAGCLAGVSRGLVIEGCGVDVDQRDVPLEVLYMADEAFLTSATRDVQPIRSVDGRGVPSCPGPVTERVAAAYAALLAADPDPAPTDAYSR
ncbi:MAG: branched-chain amino acid aminotransferase [Acidimicrobiaceae bacterium]|nr:branched-chain amino acid aminotransferase [Acidimicrobiaceae bacterium]MDQ1399021.1 branched-chain amino acid aminotransferase [Acidimicrobiaceae bacterium]MDQ1421544.1 branched-chain amino acid aminotransferase [Acidimicrobiaceae bacterium]